jgi:membrane protein YqaA with SNARE-associated domain
MKIFSKLYNKVKNLAVHPHAIRYLAAVSFIESSFFPIPPDVILGPMCIAKSESSYRYAAIAMLFSVIGGLFGYAIGYLAFETVVTPLIEYFNYSAQYNTALVWFDKWGFCAIIIAGFTPIPYKMFTIGAGVLQYNIPLFIIGSIIGRGARFFLVAAIVKFGGAKFERLINRSVDLLGWLTVGAIVIFAGYKFVL